MNSNTDFKSIQASALIEVEAVKAALLELTDGGPEQLLRLNAAIRRLRVICFPLFVEFLVARLEYYRSIGGWHREGWSVDTEAEAKQTCAKEINAECLSLDRQIYDPEKRAVCTLLAIRDRYGAKFVLENKIGKRRHHTNADLRKLMPFVLGGATHQWEKGIFM